MEAPNPATVILQSVQLEDVKNLRGGGGKFDIDLKNCPGVLTRVRLIFQAANSGTVSGYASEFLDNMAASDPAKNVALGLLADRGGNRWEYVRIDGKTLFPDSDIYIFRKEEEKVKFETVYLIPHGKDKEEATAGNFEAAMQFTVLYQ
ncbi:hypothetical protein D9M71_541380 [compost metagenome]